MDINGLFSVKGKVALVTGGAKGIGRMISEGFVTAGVKVYIVSRDEKALIQSTKELNELAKLGGSCSYLVCDLSKYEAIVKMVEEFEKLEPFLNILVNNAGATWGAPLSEFPDSGFTKVIQLNLQRVFTLTQKLTPHLLKSVHGVDCDVDDLKDGPFEDPARIINIGSVDGIRVPRLETYSYSASKAALHQLSRVFANQLGPKGINSNAIAAGAFPTHMMKATLENAKEIVLSGIPASRIGTPEDISGLCLFLGSRGGAWVNGAIIPLDGGALISSKM